MKETFWDKVGQCKHTNISPDYYSHLHCECGGWEEHCLDCGVYISKCECGEMAGMSGWPIKRWRERRRDE